jgi:hypothetical protein
LGKVGGRNLKIGEDISLSIEKMEDTYKNSLRRYVEAR